MAATAAQTDKARPLLWTLAGRFLLVALLPENLQTAEAIAAFQAHAEASGDLDYIEHAREVAARARTMHGIAS